jgi:hypothetical protein
MDVSGEIHVSTTLHPWEEPQYPLSKNLGGLLSQTGGLEKKKFSCLAGNRNVTP